MSEKFPGNVQENSDKFPGNVWESCRKCPTNVKDMSGKTPGMFCENSERFWTNHAARLVLRVPGTEKQKKIKTNYKITCFERSPPSQEYIIIVTIIIIIIITIFVFVSSAFPQNTKNEKAFVL